MLAVGWLEANAGTTEKEMAVPTPEQLSRVSIKKRLDLFRTTCKVLRIPKEIERIWASQRLVPHSDEGMGIRAREASYVPKHGSISIFPARYRTGSLKEIIPDT